MLIGSKIAEFDDDVGRAVADLGRGAAHDAGDADRPGRVGDDQRLGVELALDVVERLEPLPGPGAPDEDPAVVDRGRIERVDRLAELDHHVVRGVDDVADRALAGGEQAHLDAIRRRPDVDVAHPATDEARTEVAIDDLDRRAARSSGGPIR